MASSALCLLAAVKQTNNDKPPQPGVVWCDDQHGRSVRCQGLSLQNYAQRSDGLWESEKLISQVCVFHRRVVKSRASRTSTGRSFLLLKVLLWRDARPTLSAGRAPCSSKSVSMVTWPQLVQHHFLAKCCFFFPPLSWLWIDFKHRLATVPAMKPS